MKGNPTWLTLAQVVNANLYRQLNQDRRQILCTLRLISALSEAADLFVISEFSGVVTAFMSVRQGARSAVRSDCWRPDLQIVRRLLELQVMLGKSV